MASPESPSVDDIRNSILEDGFYFSEDLSLGQQVEKMNENGTPFASAAGLAFCKDNVLGNRHIWFSLTSFFKWFGLGLYRSFGGRPGDYMFKSSDPKAGVDCLLVHLLSKGSRLTFWGGSHHYPLASIPGENNLWLVPRAALNHVGLKPTEHTFTQGGFAILDPRTAVEITEGGTITFAFAPKEVLDEWKPMQISKSNETEQIVNLIKKMNVGVNITYVGGKT